MSNSALSAILSGLVAEFLFGNSGVTETKQKYGFQSPHENMGLFVQITQSIVELDSILNENEMTRYCYICFTHTLMDSTPGYSNEAGFINMFVREYVTCLVSRHVPLLKSDFFSRSDFLVSFLVDIFREFLTKSRASFSA